VICGAVPTVKSHLFPRSLVRRIRGDEKAVFEGNRAQPGLRLSQSGLWDDAILCDKHEARLASADDYIARFCRRFEKSAVLSTTGNSYTSPNSRPDLLIRFVAATVWRHAVSYHGRVHGLDLGPYRQIIEKHLFDGGPMPLEALVGRSNIIDPSGKRLEFGLAPYKRKLLRWTVWHFTIGGFDFYLKTDRRPFPIEWKQFLANDNDPITTPLIDPVRLTDVRMLEPIFAQMVRGRRQSN
jgi:hypothetical protein